MKKDYDSERQAFIEAEQRWIDKVIRHNEKVYRDAVQSEIDKGVDDTLPDRIVDLIERRGFTANYPVYTIRQDLVGEVGLL